MICRLTLNLVAATLLTSSALGVDVGLPAQDTLGITFQYRVDPPVGSLLKGRLIHVTLRNEGPGDVSIIQVELRLDGDLSFSREDLHRQQLPCKSCKDPYRIEQQIASGREVEFTFEYPKGSVWLPVRNLELTNFEPGMHKLEFRAQVQNPLSQNSAKILKFVDFDVQAPALVVGLGGAAGGLFLSFYRTGRRVLRPRSKKRIIWTRQVFEAGIALALGGTTALILSVVGGFLTNKALGLQIAATSFSGGFIIGFLSCGIADMWPTKLDT